MHCTSSDLHVAIYSSNIPVLKRCIKRKDLIDTYWRGCTPVSSALYLKRYGILEMLVKRGANVNLISKDNKMEPPLFAACRLADKIAINILLSAPSIDLEQRDFFGRTAFWAAARYARLDIIELLLSKGVDLNSKRSIYHPIRGALEQNWVPARNIIHFFLRRGSIICAADQESLLRKSVEYVDRETFRLCVSAGCKVNSYQNWLSFNKLPEVWQKDESFCNWIASLNGSPPSLLNITACFVRTLLIKKCIVLSPEPIKKLNLPDSLNNLLLLQV